MAQFIMEDLVNKAGLSDKIEVSSAACNSEKCEVMHQGVAAKLRMENIHFGEHHLSCPFEKKDYATSDLIICMDDDNIEKMKEICDGDPDRKIIKMAAEDIPWEKRGMNKMFDKIKSGCENLLEEVKDSVK
ncbi:MAG: hypothetical protein K6G55_03180 [Selenomonadaceae bacterium]|nr:hypothetical protein [Selenomonadaceae bacterium]